MSPRVLLADGDTARSQSIAEACGERGLECGVATHGAAALEAALADPPLALVAQMDLPLIDGPRLAAILRANPRTQNLAVLYVADRPVDPDLDGVTGQVFPASADPDEVAGAVHALLQRAEPQPAAAPPGSEAAEAGGVEGNLAELSLADLLQLFHVSRKTGTVEVFRQESPNRRRLGRVFLHEGDVVQAVVGTVEGEKALYRLLAWDRGSFAFKPHPLTTPHTIRMPTRALLREGLRQLAEWERLEVDLPAQNAQVTLRIQRSALPNVIHPLTQEVLMVLELYSGVGAVVDHCSYPDYQVLRTLHTLIQRGLVVLAPAPAASELASDAPFIAPARVARLREWLDSARPRGGAPRDAKLVVVASDAATTRDFTRALERVPGVDLDERVARGSFGPDDLGPLGRIAVDPELGVEILHVPAEPRFAPLWPLAGHGALAILLLLSGPVEAAMDGIREAAEALGRRPQARLFHVLLYEKGERVAPETVRENLALFDEGSLFLIPQDNPKKAEVLLREMFARVLP